MPASHLCKGQFLRTAGQIAVLLIPSVLLAGQQRDLAWLRGKCPQGGAVAWEYGRTSNKESAIKLFELATGVTSSVATGWHPEFSPDGSKLAWMSGTTAKGRMRSGDLTIRTIANGVNAATGVHWLGNAEVVLVKGGSWYRVSLDGKESAIPALTSLGTGGEETDVKLRADNTWAWLSGTQWKSSDGRSGATGGDCSGSLSPDGRRVTGLIPNHDECNLRNIVDGSNALLYRTLADCSDKGFDNHRWSSNDARFVVAQYECQNKTGIWEISTGDVFLAGDCTGESYGDFTLGSGTGDPWPGTVALASMRCDLDTLRFEALAGGAAPSAKVVRIYTQNGTLQGVTTSGKPSWLGLNPGATSGAAIDITNSPAIGSLQAGTYTGKITVTSTNAGSVSYAVMLTVFARPPVTLTAPNGTEVLTVDTIFTIRWDADETRLTKVNLYVSPDSGRSWLIINTAAITSVDANWERYPWKVPASTEGKTLAGRQCLVMVQDYQEGSGMEDESDRTFTIRQRTTSVAPPGGVDRLSVLPRRMDGDVRMLDASGRTVTRTGNRTKGESAPVTGGILLFVPHESGGGPHGVRQTVFRNRNSGRGK